MNEIENKNEIETRPSPERILPVFIEDEMQKSYLDYSMSMITSRALPDVRDGLKPVHRRIMFAMSELGLHHNRPPVKCARVVGEVIGKYHPHGDSAVYDSLVRMAQNFSMRYMMVRGQGNFGNVDGDSPAAMRYTECRMTPFAEEMLTDIDKDTVDFIPNYDDKDIEPTVLPAKLPFLLLNGTTGIAVGMATNMAPHNLREIVDGLVMVIDNPDVGVDELITVVPGPDFPTGGIVFGRGGIYSAYSTGRGRVIMRARAEVQKLPNDREEIIITEIPYMVNKAMLLVKIADLVRDKVIEGITFVRDESDRSGMRVVIGIKKDAFGDVVLNQLFKYTALQSTFGIINLALVNKRPQVLSLKELMCHFLDHRHEVVVRRTEFDLKKAKERAHILEGLRIALDHIDEIITLIRSSESPDIALAKLVERFEFSEIQAKAILDMRLQRLTGLERDKIEAEYQDLMKLIDDLNDILANRDRRMNIIKTELLELKNRYGDERRTEITDAVGDVDIEDMIADEDMVITMTHEGYIKRTAASVYRAQGRGGKGIKGMDSKESDFITTMFVASAHAYILFYTDKGRCYRIKVYKIPEAGRNSKGRPIVNVLELLPDEKVAAFVSVKEFDETRSIIAATERGQIIKQPLTAYETVLRAGKKAFTIDEGDKLIEVKITSGNDDVILGTARGMAVRFHEKTVRRSKGRGSRGVRGIRFKTPEDKLVGMIIASEENDILTVTDKGYGRRTAVADYRKTNRGGKGIINIKLNPEKNGSEIISIKRAQNGQDLLIITKNGIIIRMIMDSIRQLSRVAKGVKLINLDDDDTVIDIAICDHDDDDETVVTAAPVEAVPEDNGTDAEDEVLEELEEEEDDVDDEAADDDEVDESDENADDDDE